jgi:hypothetical protein
MNGKVPDSFLVSFLRPLFGLFQPSNFIYAFGWPGSFIGDCIII